MHFRFASIALGTALGLTLGTAGMAHTATGQAASKPAWPDNGVAQRMFPGAYSLFVENDHGKWRAWAINGDGADAQALDFFSGETLRVKTEPLDNTRQQVQSFVDTKGGVHVGEYKGFKFSLAGRGSLPGGIWFEDKMLSLKGSNYHCSVDISGIKGGLSDNDWKGENSKWLKVAIYHVAARKDQCSSGHLESSIHAAIDLNDGTFLAAMGCWVFRLRKSDLSPVGLAPGLRIIDKAAVQAAIDQAKGKNIEDATGYLAKVLNLSFDATNSCKSAY
ncbi:hypothetical protein [Rhodanobacter sp. L36]|uniref:hypothetical protein n=1 Tax=Rhodanobacter sp. L36 TaxID=1747221 RepID=UPI00131A99B7|nr:hypothetical protein [Rhodanobacter sp. L36]